MFGALILIVIFPYMAMIVGAGALATAIGGGLSLAIGFIILFGIFSSTVGSKMVGSWAFVTGIFLFLTAILMATTPNVEPIKGIINIIMSTNGN